jgi:hypothetical protein
MKCTFSADKRKPGSYLARVEVSGDEPWPDFGSEVTLTRMDGSLARIILGSKCVWSGPDGEKPGVEVALFTIERSLDEPKGRKSPGKRAPPK